MTPDLDGVGEGERFGLHLAEGVDEAAADEVRAIAAKGLLTRDLIAVHGVGMDSDGIARFRASGAALVWCPSSNLFLFGRTAPAALLDDGIDVLLGSDSLLTGAGDLLDELACARAIGGLSDARLEGAVGVVAAARLGLDRPALDPGDRADLLLLPVHWPRRAGLMCCSSSRTDCGCSGPAKVGRGQRPRCADRGPCR